MLTLDPMLLPSWINASWLRRFRLKLHRWYEKNHRSLPWRDTRSAYAIWVSEIMLQQTQVATVIPFFARFLKRFESVEALANANEAEVLKYWEGLGYYRRARQMHAAAQQIVARHQGIFPTTFDDVLALPGIGRYTAGAICSFAYDQPTPIVEANTQRLYARLLRLSEPLSTKESQSMLWSFAEEILPSKNRRITNQAVMELGSLICQPKPNCIACPLSELCPTFSNGLQAEIPVPKKKMSYESRNEVALIIANSQKQYLIRQCGLNEWWAGLWDFPRFEFAPSLEIDEHAKDIASKAKQIFGLACRIQAPLFSIKHSVTKYRISLNCYSAKLLKNPQSHTIQSTQKHSLLQSPQLQSPQLQSPQLQSQWVSLSDLESIPLSASGRKIVKQLTVRASPWVSLSKT